MRCSPDPRTSDVCALVFLLGSALVLPNQTFAHNFNPPSPESQTEACAAPSLRQVNYRIEPPTTPGFRRAPAFALGDLNQDGQLDFLTGALDVSARFLNRGNGTFQILPNLDSFFQDAAIADFNQDGYADVASLNADVVNVNLGYNPTWPAVPVLTATVVGRWATTIRAGDFNSDGKLDLAVGNYQDNTLTLFPGDGRGAYDTLLGLRLNVGVQPLSLLSGDFDGDGKSDLAFANSGATTVSVLLNGCGR